MSDLLYLTADDTTAVHTGGGRVTAEESRALRELGPCEVWDGNILQGGLHPWNNDKIALEKAKRLEVAPKLCHVYAGCFSQTLDYLKSRGTKISYTAVAHDVSASRKAHEDLGIPFNHEHLNDPVQFKKYIRGYIEADVTVCPSTVPEKTIRGQGRTGTIVVIPHGTDIPEKVEPLPKRYTVGYLGSLGCDKQVSTLLKAWKKLNYRDATLLLAGRDTMSQFAAQLMNAYGGGAIQCMGWVDDVSDFYNRISCFCVASATEGWNLEVGESLAHGRFVICSDAAGAVDVIRKIGSGVEFQAGNVDQLVEYINLAKTKWNIQGMGEAARKNILPWEWSKIRQQYINLWKGMLS